MSNFDAECLSDIERRKYAGFAPSDRERDFLIRLAHEALAARKGKDRRESDIRDVVHPTRAAS
jgi:hypothetical protein